MALRMKGRAWVFGDNVPNDDGIMPLSMTREQIYDPSILSQHCFEQLEPRFVKEVREGDIVVGGKNFGFGNAHIQGFLGLKGCGVGIVAESMARAPTRTCVNAGVPLLCPVEDIAKSIQNGDEVSVDFETGIIRNLTQNVEIRGQSLPPVMSEIIAAGGGMEHMRQQIGTSRGEKE